MGGNWIFSLLMIYMKITLILLPQTATCCFFHFTISLFLRQANCLVKTKKFKAKFCLTVATHGHFCYNNNKSSKASSGSFVRQYFTFLPSHKISYYSQLPSYRFASYSSSRLEQSRLALLLESTIPIPPPPSISGERAASLIRWEEQNRPPQIPPPSSSSPSLYRAPVPDDFRFEPFPTCYCSSP